MQHPKHISPTLIFLIGIVLLVFLTVYLYSVRPISTSTSTFPEYMSVSRPIVAPRGTISVIMATSSLDQERGLSYREILPENQGMLFVFEQPGSYAFWMKDMHFPLDMIWINENKTVVGISHNTSPLSFPDTFMPPSPISYVLEVNAGAADIYGIATGTLLQF